MHFTLDSLALTCVDEGKYCGDEDEDPGSNPHNEPS